MIKVDMTSALYGVIFDFVTGCQDVRTECVRVADPNGYDGTCVFFGDIDIKSGICFVGFETCYLVYRPDEWSITLDFDRIERDHADDEQLDELFADIEKEEMK